MEVNVELNTSHNKLGSMLGLARKAGKLSYGTDRITDSIRNKHPNIVLMASDISENTRKRIENCCKYYKTEYGNLDMTMDILSHYLGQTSAVSAVSIMDKGFTAAILDIINSTTVVKRNNPQEV
ncbi:MAG: L7Ae/L30e/S12e/Gadd45 family ribosomal protein [Eubacteriales bacterium]